VLTVKLKGDVDSTVTLNGDSTQYSVDFTGITSLSSDSVMFKTAGAGLDSIWRGLPDSTFAANRALRITFSAWFSDATVYLDSLIVTTFALTPEIAVDPAIYAYGNINVNDSSSTTIDVINSGIGTLTVTDINWVTAAQIAVNDTDFTVAADDTNTITVWFKPQSAGALVDTLTIVNDDADESNLTVPLSATGVAVATTTRNDFQGNQKRARFRGW
jgi:hypothetical protein